MRKTTGRRLNDKLYTRLLYIFTSFFLGHFITKKFPGLIFDFSTELVRQLSFIVDAVGGLGALALLFQVYKWHKERKK